MRLFKQRGFSSASATTFLLGGALFGVMIVLPLYYQLARGESALTAGLLMAPQGVGAAAAMPIAGRLSDRSFGNAVPLIGVAAMTVATIPFAFLASDTGYGLLGGILVLRGFGLGFAMMPSMAAAYATLEHAAVPRATSALNVVNRVGGSIGTALLAVILQHELATQLGGSTGGGVFGDIPDSAREQAAPQLAEAFSHTFTWAIALSAVALIPATILARTPRRVEGGTPPAPPVPEPDGESKEPERDAVLSR